MNISGLFSPFSNKDHNPNKRTERDDGNGYYTPQHPKKRKQSEDLSPKSWTEGNSQRKKRTRSRLRTPKEETTLVSFIKDTPRLLTGPFRHLMKYAMEFIPKEVTASNEESSETVTDTNGDSNKYQNDDATTSYNDNGRSNGEEPHTGLYPRLSPVSSPALSPIISRSYSTAPSDENFQENPVNNLSQSFQKVNLLDELRRRSERNTFDTYKRQVVTAYRAAHDTSSTSFTQNNENVVSPSPSRTSSQNTSWNRDTIDTPDKSSPSPRVKQSSKFLEEDKDYLNALNESRQNIKDSTEKITKKLFTPKKTTQNGAIDLTGTDDEEDNQVDRRDISNRRGTPFDTYRRYIMSPLEAYNKKKREEEEQRRQERIEYSRQRLRELSEISKREQERRSSMIIERMEDAKAYPPLTEEEEEAVELALDDEYDDENDVLSEGFNMKVTRGDISRLRDGEWLNDEVINFYLSIVSERNQQSDALPKCHIFNTFFYPMLSERGYERVKKWTRRVDIFSMDKIIVPIHLGNHWCLAVINMNKKRFEYYDSLSGGGGQVLKHLRKYVEQEHMDKKKTPVDLAEWTNYIPNDIPQQHNGYDCGVFMCRYADNVAKDKNFKFGQKNMKYFRKRMVLDIINKTYSA